MHDITLKIRQDDKNNWNITDPVLESGELGYETDTGKLKIGNGVDAWSLLMYFPNGNNIDTGASPINYLLASNGDGTSSFRSSTDIFSNIQTSIDQPTVIIPKPIYANQLIEITITNYDSEIDYNISCDNGIISRDGNKVYYTAPELSVVDSIHINSRTINVNINDPVIEKPVIENVASGKNNVVLQSSEFKFEGDSENNIHKFTRWQLSDNSSFNNIIYDSENISNNLTKIEVKNLTGDTTYYARVKYISINDVISQYSDSVEFITDESYGLDIDIGDEFEGGYYAGIIKDDGVNYYVIVSPKEYEIHNIEMKTKYLNNKLPDSMINLTNGHNNTMAMINDGNPLVYPAAHKVDKLEINGFSDWYIPSRDELELLFRNFKPDDVENYVGKRTKVDNSKYDLDKLNNSNGFNENSVPVGSSYNNNDNPSMTNIELFKKDNKEVMEYGSNYYWSSSCFSESSVWVQSYLLTYFGLQTSSRLNKKRHIRAVRRVKVI